MFLCLGLQLYHCIQLTDTYVASLSAGSIEEKSLFPYLDMSGLSHINRIAFQNRLETDTSKIMACYNHLIAYVQRSLENSRVSLEEVKHFVLDLTPFDKEGTQKIQAAETLFLITTLLKNSLSASIQYWTVRG